MSKKTTRTLQKAWKCSCQDQVGLLSVGAPSTARSPAELSSRSLTFCRATLCLSWSLILLLHKGHTIRDVESGEVDPILIPGAPMVSDPCSTGLCTFPSIYFCVSAEPFFELHQGKEQRGQPSHGLLNTKFITKSNSTKLAELIEMSLRCCRPTV